MSRLTTTAEPRRKRTVEVIVFTIGISAIGALAAVIHSAQSLDESSILYAAVAIYVVYVGSSLTLASNMTATETPHWTTQYTVSMLPVALLTSWPPIAVVGLDPFPLGLPFGIRLLVDVLSSVLTAYASAWILLWLSRRLWSQHLIMRGAVCSAAVVVPVAFWLMTTLLIWRARSII